MDSVQHVEIGCLFSTHNSNATFAADISSHLLDISGDTNKTLHLQRFLAATSEVVVGLQNAHTVCAVIRHVVRRENHERLKDM